MVMPRDRQDVLQDDRSGRVGSNQQRGGPSSTPLQITAQSRSGPGGAAFVPRPPAPPPLPPLPNNHLNCRLTKASANITPTMACKAAGKETRTSIAQVSDTTWLPTMAEIATAYNLTGQVANNININFDAAAADRTMRFQLAFYAGLRIAANQVLQGADLEDAPGIIEARIPGAAERRQ